MAVVFVGTSASDFVGGMSKYTGAAESRDTDYASEEIAADCVSNSTGDAFETPEISISGNLMWIHFRVVFPSGSNSGSADGAFIHVEDDSGDVLGGIDWQNGDMRALADSNIEGSAYSQSPGTVYTIDLKIDCSSSKDVELYVDGLLVSSASASTGSATPAVIKFKMDDMLGVGNPSAPMYISEFLVDDANTTIGCRVHTATATSDGTYTEMSGTYTAVQDASDTDSLLADANGERFSWNPPTYTGDVSGVSVRAVLVKSDVQTGVGGPNKFTPFLRIGSTDYYGSQEDPGSGVPIVSSYSWANDPSTSAAWDIADVDAFEVGIRAET